MSAHTSWSSKTNGRYASSCVCHLSVMATAVTEAATGTAGVFHAIMQTPDVVVLDLGLPDIDGMEVIRRIRESSQVPIIVISARGQRSRRSGGFERRRKRLFEQAVQHRGATKTH